MESFALINANIYMFGFALLTEFRLLGCRREQIVGRIFDLSVSRLPADATTKAIVNTSKLTPMPHSTRSTRESSNCLRRRSLISVQQPDNLRSECYRTKWKSFFIKACSQNRLERIRLLQQSICEITQTLSFVLFSPLLCRALLVSQRKHYRES